METKIKIIEELEAGLLSQQAIANKHHCSKAGVQFIWKQREAVREKYENKSLAPVKKEVPHLGQWVHCHGCGYDVQLIDGRCLYCFCKGLNPGYSNPHGVKSFVVSENTSQGLEEDCKVYSFGNPESLPRESMVI